MIEDLLAAAVVVFNWQTIVAISLGTIVGLMIGAIPGLSATMGMALLSPFTFFVSPLVGIPFLIGLFKGGTFGGSISAILIGTPGTAANAATLLDGYEMRKQGRAGTAMMGALNASLIGDVFGTVALIFGAPALALIAIQFGPHEFFALVLFSLTMICYVSGRSLAKGVLAASLGVFFALIGTDPIGGTERLSFGIRELQGGLNVIALVTGLFGITEVLIQMESFGRGRQKVTESVAVHLSGAGMQLRAVVSNLWTIVRSSLVGTFIGALPGIGSETSPWVAYGLAKRASKTPEKFGQGAYEGVVAPEAANNAVCAAAMIPMLVFGIPGDIVTAILMSALIAQGLQPGPFLIFRASRRDLRAVHVGAVCHVCPLYLRAIDHAVVDPHPDHSATPALFHRRRLLRGRHLLREIEQFRPGCHVRFRTGRLCDAQARYRNCAHAAGLRSLQDPGRIVAQGTCAV